MLHSYLHFTLSLHLKWSWMIRSLALHRAHHKNILSSHNTCMQICAGSVFGINNLLTEAPDRFSCCTGIVRTLQSSHIPHHIACMSHTTCTAQHFTSSNGQDSQMLQSEVHWEADKEEEVDYSCLKSLLNQAEPVSALLYLICLHVAFKEQIFFSVSEMKASVISKPLFE